MAEVDPQQNNYADPASTRTDIHADPDYGDDLLNQASTQETSGKDWSDLGPPPKQFQVMGPGMQQGYGPLVESPWGNSVHNFSGLDPQNPEDVDRMSGFGHVS